MTSRVLQENTDLILTENSNVLINDNFISIEGFVTGTPVVSTSSIGQQHNITCTGITTSPVVVSTSNISQQHDLSCNIIVTGNAVVNNAVFNQIHGLQVVSFTTGQPVVSNSTMIEDEAINVPSFTTGNPVLQTTAITQQHNLSPYSILTPSPDVGEADDPTKQEIEELEKMFGGWGRRTYEVPDGKLVQAEREVQVTFGDVISIDKKAKSLIEFGRSGNLSANGDLETIWTVGGNETYVTGNTIAYISSSSASDTEEITIECHTVDYFILTGAYGAISKKQAASGDFYLEERKVGKVFRQSGAFSASSAGGPFDIEFDPAIIICKNSDVRFRVETSVNNSVVFAIFKGYLASVTT